jgi:hypothetical protein
MDQYSNYPRSPAYSGLSLDELRSLVSKLNVFAAVLLISTLTAHFAGNFVPASVEIEDLSLVSQVLLAVGFVALILLVALQAMWGAWTVRAVGDIHGDSLRFSPRWVGFFSAIPVIGIVTLAYVIEYAITSCTQPRLPSMRWNSLWSKSMFSNLVGLSASLNSGLEFFYYFYSELGKNEDKFGPYLTAVHLVTAIIIYLGMRLATKNLMLLAERLESQVAPR